MPQGFAGIVLALLAHGPEFLADAEGMFNAIAHGPGGMSKISNVLKALEHLAGIGNAVFSDAGRNPGQQAGLAAQQQLATETGQANPTQS